MEYNIICDVAGNLKTLMALIEQMPKSATPLSVGDMVDRGPDSKGVLDFFMNNGEAIIGNHEHMMVTTLNKTIGQPEEYGGDQFKDYFTCNTQLGAFAIWAGSNGGYDTLKSFGIDPESINQMNVVKAMQSVNAICQQVPIKYRDWINCLPLYKEVGHLIITHAPIKHSLKRDTVWTNYWELDNSVIWNRTAPAPIKDKLQIFGHNWKYKEYRRANGDLYAMCIDNNANNELVGVHYPSMQVYRQPFLGD